MGGMMRRVNWITFIVVLILMSVSCNVVSSTDEGPDIKKNGNDEPNRKINEQGPKGGLWYDDFSDTSDIDFVRDLVPAEKGYMMDIPIMESFENYTDGQSLFGINGWFEDTSRILTSTDAEFTASTDTNSTYPSSVVGKIYNPSDKFSYVLSKKINYNKGFFFFWFSSSLITYGDSGSMQLMISLLKTDSDYPENSDRIVSFLLRDGGVGYRTDPQVNSNMIVNSGITENTWYFTTINFSCSTEKADITVYDSNMNVLGSAMGTDFISSTSSIKRIEITTARDRNGYFTTSYWDDIGILDDENIKKGYIRSNPISISEDQRWSHLIIDKEEPGDSQVKINIYDGNNNPIDENLYDPYSDSIDLSSLNDKGIKSIILQANLTNDFLISPTIKGWGLQWNDSRSWSDNFLTTDKISWESNVRYDNFTFIPEDNRYSSYIESITINLPDDHYWYRLHTSTIYNEPVEVLFDIVDSSTGGSIKGYRDLSGSEIDISDIDPFQYDSIRIRCEMINKGISSPIKLNSWAVEWKPNDKPDIHGIEGNPSCFRGSNNLFKLDISDPNEPASDLFVSVKYKNENSSEWKTNMIEGVWYSTENNSWEFIFNTTDETNIGNYSFLVNVVDSYSDERELIFDNIFSIRNNVPISPLIELWPVAATTDKEIHARISEKGSDIETALLLYDFYWFVNDVEIVEARNIGLWSEADPTLTINHFAKNDKVECRVRAYDGMDYSEWENDSIVIRNSPPKMISEDEIIYEYHEDENLTSSIGLHDFVMDADKDDLDFSLLADTPLFSTNLDGNELWIDLHDNMNGEENITINCTDGTDEIQFKINIKILPVNDPPTGYIVNDAEITIEIEEAVHLSSIVEDIETDQDEISISWFDGDNSIGTGPSITTSWDKEGLHNVTCYIDDGDINISIGHVGIEVIDSTPPFPKDNVEKAYNSDSGSITYDIIDIAGNIQDVRAVDSNKIDISSLTSEVIGSNLRITLEMMDQPYEIIEINSDISFSYYVYFVKEDWSEPEFISGELTPSFLGSLTPSNEKRYDVGTYLSNGYLSYGEGMDDLGSPVVGGNSITWSIPLELLIKSEIELTDFNLYAVAQYTENTGSKVVQSFDTVGHGASSHIIDGSPAGIDKDEKENDEGIPLILFLLILFLNLIFLIAIIGLILVVMKGKRKNIDEADESGPEAIPTQSDTMGENIAQPNDQQPHSPPVPETSPIPLTQPPLMQGQVSSGDVDQFPEEERIEPSADQVNDTHQPQE